MALDFNGSTQYVQRAAFTAVTGYPFSFACWINPDDITFGTADKYIFSIADTAANNNYFALLVKDADSKLRAAGVNLDAPSAVRAWDTTATVSTAAWQHVAGVFTAATDIIAYLNANSAGAYGNTQDPSPVGTDSLSMGALVRSNVVAYFDGKIAEAGLWNVALTAAEIAMLEEGWSPLQVRPASLVAYWPIIGRVSPEPDWVGGFDLTLTNAPANAAHAPVMPPYAWVMQRGVFVPAAAGGAVGRGLTGSLRLDRPRLVA